MLHWSLFFNMRHSSWILLYLSQSTLERRHGMLYISDDFCPWFWWIEHQRATHLSQTKKTGVPSSLYTTLYTTYSHCQFCDSIYITYLPPFKGTQVSLHVFHHWPLPEFPASICSSLVVWCFQTEPRCLSPWCRTASMGPLGSFCFSPPNGGWTLIREMAFFRMEHRNR